MRGIGRSAISIASLLTVSACASACATTTGEKPRMSTPTSEPARLRRTRLRAILDLWDLADPAATADRTAAARDDARRWLGSLDNDPGWTLHDGGDAEGALVLLERAVTFRGEAGELPPLQGEDEVAWLRVTGPTRLERIEALAPEE